MIIGTGIDTIEIERIEQAVKKESFVRFVFTDSELDYCTRTDDTLRACSLAGFFAAKEAYVKALGSGFREIRPNEIEVSHNDMGAPFLKIQNHRGLPEGAVCHLSISHDRSHAVAVVMIEVQS